MKVGERGRVTIPKDIRERFGIGPDTEVEFHVVNGSILLTKAPKKLNLGKWRGRYTRLKPAVLRRDCGRPGRLRGSRFSCHLRYRVRRTLRPF